MISCDICEEQFQTFRSFSEHSFLCGLKHALIKVEVTEDKMEEIKKVKIENDNSDRGCKAKRETFFKHVKCDCKNCIQGSKNIREKHRIHSCNFCEKEFKRTDKLNAHMSKHTGIFLYKCNVCDRKFSRSDKMKRHTIEKHTSIRPHSCNACLVSFSRLEQLKIHKCRSMLI